MPSYPSCYLKKIKFLFPLVLSALLIVQNASAQTEAKQAILQGAILVHPDSQPSQYQTEKIQPGHLVKFSVLVENKGNTISPPGQIYIRYAFAKPLTKEPSSILFETEKTNLPAIEPGQSLEISFNALHKLPALPDFIRDDWGMREYQILMNEQVIGTLAINFSAYYYPGIRKEIPLAIDISNDAQKSAVQ